MLLPEMFACLPASATTAKDVPHATRGTAFSLIAILRYFLLFIVAGSNPIPANAMDLRDKSVSAAFKDQAGELLMLVLEAINTSSSESERQNLQSLVVTSIFTVPQLK